MVHLSQLQKSLGWQSTLCSNFVTTYNVLFRQGILATIHIHQLIVFFLAVHLKLQPRTPVQCPAMSGY